jgi:hypothetical protein
LKYYNNTNNDLPLYNEVPENGLEIDVHGSFTDGASWEILKTYPEYLHNTFYYCNQCKGYIAGQPSQDGENSIGPLAGRCGTSYNCIRCGYELGFHGYMS